MEERKNLSYAADVGIGYGKESVIDKKWAPSPGDPFFFISQEVHLGEFVVDAEIRKGSYLDYDFSNMFVYKSREVAEKVCKQLNYVLRDTRLAYN